jgi:acetyltransferase-like isoleucine patch superfamily enzyme
MIGHNAYVTAHAIVYDKLVLEPVTIGRGATIGVNAVVMPGVEVGERAVVAPGAVVPRGTRIPAGEFWGGVPARKIRGMLNADGGAPEPRPVLGGRQPETWAAD